MSDMRETILEKLDRHAEDPYARLAATLLRAHEPYESEQRDTFSGRKVIACHHDHEVWPCEEVLAADRFLRDLAAAGE